MYRGITSCSGGSDSPQRFCIVGFLIYESADGIKQCLGPGIEIKLAFRRLVKQIAFWWRWDSLIEIFWRQTELHHVLLPRPVCYHSFKTKLSGGAVFVDLVTLLSKAYSGEAEVFDLEIFCWYNWKCRFWHIVDMPCFWIYWIYKCKYCVWHMVEVPCF